MALAMVFSAFAADPTLEPAFKDFKGSASLGYKADLDAKEFGMTNSASAEITFSFAGEATKATEGEGIWGELEIKTAAEKCLSESSVSVEKAKIHFGEAFAIDVKNHDVALGKNGPDFVTGDFSAKTAGIAAKKTNTGKEEKKGYVEGTYTLNDDDHTSVQGKYEVTYEAPADEAVFTNGFTAEIALDKIANINVVVADNGAKAKAAKEIAFKGDIDVKAVDNLTLWGGASYNADAADGFAYAAKAGYALGDLTISAAYDSATSFGAGVMYKWGADYSDDKFAYFKGNGDDNKDFTSGASAAVKSADFKKFGLGVAAFDNATFLPGLVVGAEVIVDDVAKFSKGADDFGAVNAKYSTTFGDFGFAANAGAKYTFVGKALDFGYGVSVDNKALIQNTTLKVGYTGGKGKTGAVEASATISF